MPLQKQILDIPLSTGLDQKADLRGLSTEGAAILLNCVKLKNGAIRKRFGTVALSTTATNFGTITSAVAGGRYKNSMWMVDGTNIYAWSDKAAVWQNQDKVPEAVALDRLQVAAFAQNVVDYDMATGNGFLHAVMLAPSPNASTSTMVIWDTILDLSGFGSSGGLGGVQQGVTATVYKPLNLVDTALNAALAPKIVICGTTSVLTYIRGVNLCARSLDLTTPGAVWSAESVITSGLSAGAQTGAYDLCAVNGDTTRFALVAGETGPVTRLRICSVSTLTAVTNATLQSRDAFSVGAVAYNGSFYMAIAADAANAANWRVVGYDEGTATVLTGVSIVSTFAGITGKCAIEKSGASAFGFIVSTGNASGAGAPPLSTSQIQYGMLTITADVLSSAPPLRIAVSQQLASKPFYNAATGKAYFAISVPSLFQGTTYLACADLWSDGVTNSQPYETNVYALRPVVTLAPRLQKNVPQPMATGGSFVLPHFPTMPTVADAGAPGVTLLPTTYSTETFHMAVVAQPLDFASPLIYRSSELGDSAMLTCGLPLLYDGQLSVEAGFSNYPEISGAMNGSGGSLSAGTYLYCGTYEWIDTRGQIHRSAPSPTLTLTAVNNDKGSLAFNAPALTMRSRLSPKAAINTLPYASHIQAVLYRTTANGTVFYRQSADPQSNTNVFLNGVNTLNIADTLSDAALTAAATAQALYTTGGVLPNFNPPSARCQVQHGQRWYLGGCDNPRQIWASKGLTDGESPGFNEQLAFEATGAVRALQSMDQHLVIFVQRGTEYGIEYVDGQGPLDTGAQSDWTPPIPIPSAVGAIDQRGTCAGPFGVLFRSSVGGPNGTGGLFLLSRDFQVAYIGKNVEAALATCPIVTSMVVHPNAGRVYITTIANDNSPVISGGQTRIVWDYLENVWSTDVIWDTDAGQANAAMRCGWVAQAGGISGAPQGPAYHCVSASGRVYRESFGMGAGSYLDSGNWITSIYQGPLWKPSIGGFARFWRVQVQSDSLEKCDFSATLSFDGASIGYYSESDMWTAPAIAAFDRFPQVDVEMLVNNQKARSIQLSLSDASPTGGGVVTGQGMSWSTASLELGVKPGLYRNIPDAQRA
jgi:hypothetical protein